MLKAFIMFRIILETLHTIRFFGTIHVLNVWFFNEACCPKLIANNIHYSSPVQHEEKYLAQNNKRYAIQKKKKNCRADNYSH